MQSYPYSCFLLHKFWRNLSTLIRFFVLNYLQTLTEKQPERSLLIFKKIDVLNFISVLIFFFSFVRSKYSQVLYINVLGFTLQKARLQACFQTTRNASGHRQKNCSVYSENKSQQFFLCTKTYLPNI